MSRPQDQDRNQEATVYLGNLDERCTDALVWELMLQAGPVANVHLPKDRISQTHQGFGFCEFLTEEDADYAVKIMNQIKLFGKPIRVNKASYDKKQLDVGANLFIGNLDPLVDETMLYNTFSTFGPIATTAKVARDPQTGESKGYGFVSYNDFDHSDAAVEAMNGQYLMNKPITVQYAFKKDGKGERHGTEAERLLANQAKKNAVLPNGQFAGALAPPAPPPGFAAQNTTIPQQQPPMGMSVYQQPGATPVGQYGGAVPPPPPMMQGYPGMGTPQQPPMQMQQQQMGYPGAQGMGYPGAPQYGMPMGMQMPQMGMPMGIGMQQGGPGIPPPPPGFMTGANASPMPQR
ncbi:Splicing factor 3B subunit 4 [Naganishia friedmannii]|uniref:Splicing factor 3B subunit 4 n=1 Tax=Naganishia friedmannii TaxID=89922 RepID=A0ACC2V9G2_9TREE|nr:Splicing factor 3B subunit 4 [Naganishia friedmannii]